MIIWCAVGAEGRGQEPAGLLPRELEAVQPWHRLSSQALPLPQYTAYQETEAQVKKQ